MANMYRQMLSQYALANGTYATGEVEYADDVDTHAAHTSEMGRFADDIADAPIKDGQTLLFDKGVASKANQANICDKQIDDGIMRKKLRGKAHTGKRLVTS